MPQCQNESSYENVFRLQAPFSWKSNSFSYERFCKATRCETEAQGYWTLLVFLELIEIAKSSLLQFAEKTRTSLLSNLEKHRNLYIFTVYVQGGEMRNNSLVLFYIFLISKFHYFIIPSNEMFNRWPYNWPMI